MSDEKKDKFLFERVARAESEYFACRVWCDEETPLDMNELRIKVMNSLHFLESLRPRTDAEMATALKTELHGLCSREGVNSVEITLRLRSLGMCVHKNWP